ncbi:MAG: DUF2067 domain-containing protein [Thermoprotei archaeon]|nr:MAG: DUF2067 domain-containing protein [Thermoprotei archaeon]
MPLIKRSFYVQCRGSDCFKLAELIKEKTPTVEYIDVSVTENGIYISVYGYKTDVKNVWRHIRKLVSLYYSAVREFKGLRRVKIEYLVDKLKRTFPPRLLVVIINHMGYRCELAEKGEEIITEAPLELIESVASTIICKLDEIKYDVKGITAKYYVVAGSALLGIPVDEVYKLGIKHGHLWVDNEGKFRLRVEWKQGLNELLEKYSRRNSS